MASRTFDWCHAILLGSIVCLLLSKTAAWTPSTLTRAQALEQAWYGAWTLASATVNDSPAATTASNTERLCNSGGLVAEQAITGAYSSPCMALIERKIPLAGTSLTIRQEAAGSGATGLAVWNSGLLLVRLLQELLGGAGPDTPSTVVELGCGTGLASIASHVLGAKHVIATDGNPNIVQLAKTNVELNKVDNGVETKVLSWGLLNAMDYSESADLVIGSDLTYNSGSWPALAETMATLIKPNGYVLYVSCGHEGFNVQAEVDGFCQVAQQQGLEVTRELYGMEPAKRLPQLLNQNEVQQLVASGGARVLVLRRKQLLAKR